MNSAGNAAKDFVLKGCILRTQSLQAHTSFPALWILIGMDLDRPRCSLLFPGRCGLTPVTQTSHKEHMRIKKRIREELKYDPSQGPRT